MMPRSRSSVDDGPSPPPPSFGPAIGDSGGSRSL
eukprot:gene50942-23612_t